MVTENELGLDKVNSKTIGDPGSQPLNPTRCTSNLNNTLFNSNYEMNFVL